ncbi:uncharacterized protein TNCV_1412751 [Trichonephila clavipes]|nr:uncharacterized protein TNCV_1412751 [Trichonephila clavipes]
MGRIKSLRERGFSYHAIGARVQRKSSTVMRVWKQWTDEHRATRKTGSERRKAVGSTLVYCYRCTKTGFVNSLTSATPWIVYKGAFIQDPSHVKTSTSASAMSSEPGQLIGTKLSFQMDHASICGTIMAAFVLDAMLVNTAFQSALSNDIVA